MDPQFPGNSKGQPRAMPRDEPKVVTRVVSGEVVRRKTPLGKRFANNVLGGDVQSVWSYVFGDVLIPAARNMVADAVTGGVERAIFGENSPGRGRRGRGIGPRDYQSPFQSTPMRGIGHDNRPPAGRRGRPAPKFDEIILPRRVDAEEVLDRMEELIKRYGNVSLSDLYGLIGETGQYTDNKWGWLDFNEFNIHRVRDGYLLELPSPQSLD